MVGEACLPSNAYYPRTPDYTLCSGVHVCWSEHSDSSFVYGFMSLDYGFGTMAATTFTPPTTNWRGYFDTNVGHENISSKFLGPCSRSRSLWLFLENDCHRSAYIYQWILI